MELCSHKLRMEVCGDKHSQRGGDGVYNGNPVSSVLPVIFKVTLKRKENYYLFEFNLRTFSFTDQESVESKQGMLILYVQNIAQAVKMQTNKNITHLDDVLCK